LTKDDYGRDHSSAVFQHLDGGGGVKPGQTYGRTDDYGYNIVDADGNVLHPDKDRLNARRGPCA